MKNYIVIIIFVFLLGCSAKVPMNQDDIESVIEFMCEEKYNSALIAATSVALRNILQ